MKDDKTQNTSPLKRIGWCVFTFITLMFVLLALRTILENRPNRIAIAVSVTFLIIWAMVTYFTMIKKSTQKNNLKKDGWRPMIWLLFKEITVIIFLILIRLNWNYENDTGGNFGMAVSFGLCMTLVGITFDITAYTQSAAKPWQITLIVATILCNILAFMFVPMIMGH